jgi:hypothetical protein
MYEANTHTTDKQTFKYQSLIDQLLAMGCHLPVLSLPDDMNACRFAFDGMMTTPSTNGHFDFYEYEGCDLNKTFHITRKIA